jgi:outer membrane receptor protein involved in Fe transport
MRHSSPTTARSRRRAAATVVAVALCPAAQAADAPPATLPKVEVIGVTPLPGLTLSRDLIPAPVQSATGADIARSNAINLPEFLDRNLGSVHINDMAGNPFQSDVNYRGFVASPVLGTPQGLSVYMDGVRLNLPFGDVVSWDLIPKSAISSINLMPGSNPLFGLNTLGGALSIQTKDGRSHPGAAVQVYGGMNKRRAAEFEYGGSHQSLDWFVTGNLFRERGWRDDSPSRIGQLFGKLGWRNAATDLKLTVSHADNKVQGSALQEERLLKLDYNSLYTKPDITENKSTFVNLALNHSASDNVVLSGNVYYRRMQTNTLHADINEGALDQAVYQPNADEQAALAAAGYSGFPVAGATAANTPFPFWRCIANVLLNDEPGEKCSALVNRSRTSQNNYGFSAQASVAGSIAGHKHQFTGGAAYDASTVKFSQTTQLGFLNPDRSVTGLNAFADGVSGGTVDGVPFDNRVELHGRTHTWSLYATDTLSIRDLWHFTLSGRYNRTRLVNSDQLIPGGGAGSLDGNYTYSRFNPAVGLSITPSKAFVAYAGYSEGSRAPSSVELGCADPNNPCRLPSSLAGDPPLNQVVTKTWEAGLHGVLPSGLRWNAGLFRAENNDDILFVAAPINTQFGYFKNFGKTRREGLELGASGKTGAFSLGANYTYLNATYQSAETINAVGNSSNDTAAAGDKGLDGNIRIAPGNRIPLIPQHLFKAYADYQITSAFAAGLSMNAIGSSYARGNDNNQHTPDGVNYLGSGKSGGYAVFNLSARYQVDRQLRFFAQINNLLNRQYSSAAQLGPNGFTANGNFIARPFPATAGGDFPVQQSAFYAPGAPRTAWIGVRYQFDAAEKTR